MPKTHPIALAQMDSDLISDLPLSIIHTILCLLPLKEAVRTSILSKQWRFTWVSLPYLKFDDDDQLSDQSDSEFEEWESSVISHSLRLHREPIYRFELSFSRELEFPKFHEWIIFLSRNDISELVVNVDFKWQHLPTRIYDCSKLTHLELSNAVFCPLPSDFNGFPFLRILSLQDCVLSDELQNLLVNSPLLERLTLKNFSKSLELRINLSHLKFLSLKGLWTEIYLFAPLLTELYAEFFDYDEYVFNYKPPNRHFCNYTNFLGGCKNLLKIYGNEFFTKVLSIGIESCKQTLVFPHLKNIVLLEVDFEDLKEKSVVARLLIGAPNLEELTLSDKASKEKGDGSDVPDVSLKDFGCAPNFTFQKLRIVTIFRICSTVSGMKLVEFLLESSPVLETMSLHGINDDDYKNVKAELPAFHRASPNAKILFNRMN